MLCWHVAIRSLLPQSPAAQLVYASSMTAFAAGAIGLIAEAQAGHRPQLRPLRRLLQRLTAVCSAGGRRADGDAVAAAPAASEAAAVGRIIAAKLSWLAALGWQQALVALGGGAKELGVLERWALAYLVLLAAGLGLQLG